LMNANLPSLENWRDRIALDSISLYLLRGMAWQ
jgi:hypothetical protein